MAAIGIKKKSKGVEHTSLNFFATLFRGVWARMVPIVGVMNANVLFERALKDAIAHYPVLEHVRVREGMVQLAVLAEEHDGSKQSREALWAYLERLVELADKLSGSVVSRELLSYISAQKGGEEFSKLLYRTGLSF